jgi:hypothetical protein
MANPDPSLSALYALVGQFPAPLAAAQSTIDGLNANVVTLNNQLVVTQAQLAAAQTFLSVDTAQIAALQAALAAALSKSGLPNSPLFQNLNQLTNLQKAPGWILAGGVAGNSKGNPATGTSTWVVNGDGSATITVTPAATGYNCYWYLKTALPATGVRLVAYHVDYRLSAAAMAVRNALENEAKDYDGTSAFDLAWQLDFNTMTLRYFDYLNRAWIDTKVPFSYTAGDWIAVDELFLIDPVSGSKTNLGIAVNGKYSQVNALQAGKADTSKPWFLASVQLDTSQGKAYSCDVNNIGVIWL